MKYIQENISKNAVLTGFIHEASEEMAIEKYPVMIVLPGGGFFVCSEREGEPVAMSFYAEGYSAFVLDYTTINKTANANITDPMMDVQITLKWIYEHAVEYSMDLNKIAIIGFSGGGHLAAATATHGPIRPRAVILGYPGIVHSELRAMECPDILEAVDQETPPTFIFSSRDDTITPPVHVLSYITALYKSEIDFELHIFESGVHGTSLGKSYTCAGNKDFINPTFAQWFPLCIQWLKKKLGDFTIN